MPEWQDSNRGRAEVLYGTASDDRSYPVFQNQEETILTVKTTSGETYGFYGNLNVINNGADGGQPELELEGWLVGYDEDDSSVVLLHQYIKRAGSL